MLKVQSLLISSAILTGLAFHAVPSVAASVDPLAEDQINSVSQLSDVQPTDWAFQALQSLVERYGCVVGYPDGSYRGNRAMTRYEFAAGLNACMDRVNELIASATANLVTKEDLATLQRLQEEFATELATLRGRVDALEARTATLEAQQFSTTTKLFGEAIFAVTGVATGQDINQTDIPRITTLGYRTRLNLDTSFNGRDLLRTRLQSINLNYFSSPAGTNSQLPEGVLRFDSGPFAAGSSTVSLDALLYSFPIGDRTTVVLEGNAGATDDFALTLNPFLDGDGGSGALSNFGTRNSIYYYVSGAGIGIRHEFNDYLEISLGYLAGTPNNPAPGNGLFNGSYGTIGQIVFKPSDRFNLAFAYINAYNTNTGTGSLRSNLAFTTGLPTVTNSYGIQGSFQVSPNFVVNAWGGYTAARVIGLGDADIWSYAVGLAFPDLGKEGNLAGIIVGVEPRVAGATFPTITVANNGSLAAGTTITSVDRDTSLHVEGFYQYRVNDNITITPGLIWLTAPNHDARNAGAVIGVIRTTFTF
ncbi:hypothetical protein BST81_16195 [Leptolyngbya sp. 'hensonii']|uniref:iron uptake porin n=1 Tax=Leptolyngbya sp. 'hensonii' TaxID=1922337 RepID=UPI00094F8BDA|nr:iron uptake porin [Leptolyngbya sp. 'hensonii']OLP17343.1 hypothetical protein BST81_16195 [Leptolyngbya sp. 'hensonii']